MGARVSRISAPSPSRGTGGDAGRAANSARPGGECAVIRGAGITPITQFQPLTNTYKIEAVFERGAANQHAGLNVCVGGGNKVVIGFDGVLNNVWLDRTLAGNVAFSPAFPNVVHAPLASTAGPVKFRVFVDQSSIEVFVNDGERVLTSQIYPSAANRGVELFSSFGPSTLQKLQAWPLASIWQ